MPKEESPGGGSTGRFDSDQGDLFYNSVPKEESPVGGVPTKKVNLLVGGWSLNPILTDQVPREGPGGGGTVSHPAALVSLRTRCPV